MNDLKHLVRKESQVSKWQMIIEGAAFVAFLIAAFCFFIALSVI